MSTDWDDGGARKMQVSKGNSSEAWGLSSVPALGVQWSNNSTLREKSSKRYKLGAQSGWEYHGNTGATIVTRHRRKYISRRRKGVLGTSAGSRKPTREIEDDKEGS